MVPVNRRIGTVVRWNIVLGAAGGQDVQNAVEQPSGVMPGSADVWLRRREVFLDNFPEIIVNFPEGHTQEYYLRWHIYLGRPLRVCEIGFRKAYLWDT